jgi:prepilin-type N-terminal cleavage/methylation domain-containing protein
MVAAGSASVRSVAEAARRCARAAMTLIEVMIALSVLALGLCAVMTHYVTLYDMRQHTQHLAQVQEVVRALNERIEAADVWALGAVVVTPGPPPQYLLPWSLPRFEGGYSVTVSGVTTVLDFPPMTEKDLLAPDIALIQRPINMPELKVYCEYYRYEHDDNGTPATPTDDRPGLLDLLTNAGKTEDTAVPGDLQGEFIRHQIDTVPQCRIDPTIPPVTDVADHRTIAVRIIATWGENNVQRYELFTAKRRIPQQQ